MSRQGRNNIIVTIMMFLSMCLSLVLIMSDTVKYVFPTAIIFVAGVSLAIYLIRYEGLDIETFRNKSLVGFSAMMKMLVLLGSIIEYEYGSFMSNEGNVKFVFSVYYIIVLLLYMMEFIWFVLKNNSTKIKYVILVDFLLIYFIFSTTINSFWILVVGVTLLTTYTIYGNIQLIYAVSIGVNVVNLIAVFKHLYVDNGFTDLYDISIHVMEISIMFIYTWILIHSSIEISDLNDERVLLVREEEEKIKGLVQQMKKVVQKVKTNMVSTNKVVDELDTAMNSSLNVLHDISYGNVQNATRVEEQAHMSGNIANMIREVVDQVEMATKISEKSLDGVKLGRQSFEKIKTKSNKIVKNNKEVLNTINEFVTNTKHVRDITAGIADISEQTNLLSLNASVKSIRAGEDGKGFSVVANEIRKLAYETTELTDNINDIVCELEENAAMVQKMVNEVVEAINIENGNIDTTMAEFFTLENNIDSLNENIDVILDKIESVSDYNGEIENHISSLAVSSEEVTASTEEVLNLSEENKNKTQKTKEILFELVESVEELDK